MGRRVAWAVTLLAGGLCFYAEMRILCSDRWQTGRVVLPGTALSVRLLRPITSANAKLGESFVAYVVRSETVRGSAPVRPGTLVEGTCLAVRKADDAAHPGYVRLALKGMVDAAGRFEPLETTTVSLWGFGDPYERGGVPLEGRGHPLPGLPADRQGNQIQSLETTDALLTGENSIKFVVLKPFSFSRPPWSRNIPF
jgi:hypothetical protein